jgi:hypothetical protein
MKKLLLILLCLPMIGLASFPINTFFEECDNIILKDGNEISAKIIEITPELVKYRKCEKLDGPLISIYKKEILMLRYADGSKDILKSDKQSQVSNPFLLGILALFLGIISLFLAGIVFAPASLVLGIIGVIFDKKKTPAIIGTILGFIGLIILLANS